MKQPEPFAQTVSAAKRAEARAKQWNRVNPYFPEIIPQADLGRALAIHARAYPSDTSCGDLDLDPRQQPPIARASLLPIYGARPRLASFSCGS